MANKQTRGNHGKYIVTSYSVIELDNEHSGDRLFECIPDSWFIDETKTICYWPNQSGTRNFSLRAINCDRPDDNWGVCECKVVRGGFKTYALGFALVREKCSQVFNTSSAEDHMEAAKYRREHPVLAMQGEANIENIFSESTIERNINTNADPVENLPDKNLNLKSGSTSNNSSSKCASQSTTHEAASHRLSKQERKYQHDEIDRHYSLKNNSSKSTKKKTQKNEMSRNKKESLPNQCRRLSESHKTTSASQTSICKEKASSFNYDEHTHGNLNPSSSSHTSPSPSKLSNSIHIRNSKSQSLENVNVTDSEIHERENYLSSNHATQSASARPINSLKVTPKPNAVTSKSVTTTSDRSQSDADGLKTGNLLPGSSRNSNSDILGSSSSRSSSKHSSFRRNRNSKTLANVDQQKIRTKVQKRTGSSPQKRHVNLNLLQSRNRSRSRRSRSRSRQSRSWSRRSRSWSRRSRSCSRRRRSRSRQIRSRSSQRRRQSRQKCSQSRENRSESRQNRSLSRESRSQSRQSRSEASQSRSQSSKSRSQSSRSRSQSSRRRSRSQSQRSRRSHSRQSQLHSGQSPSHRRRALSYNSPLQSRNESQNYFFGSDTRHRKSETLDGLRSDVKQLIKYMKTSNQRQVEHERRMSRIEVTLNKAFIMIGDLANTNNLRPQHNGIREGLIDLESEGDMDEFDIPKIPIQDLGELSKLHEKLKDKRFKRFLIQKERDFCTPSKNATDTVTMSKYLIRFISLRVRCKITLKEKGGLGETLIDDYHRIYLFLIEVMRSGYHAVNRNITVHEVHTVLRTVWGRSKQLKNEEDQKKLKLKQKRLDLKKRVSEKTTKTRRRH